MTAVMTLELDDDTAGLLNEFAQDEHVNPMQLANRLIMEKLEDWLDIRAADKALAELERGEDYTISLDEFLEQVNALDN